MKALLSSIAWLALALAAPAQDKVEAYKSFTEAFAPFENSELRSGLIMLRIYPLDVEYRLWDATGMIRITRCGGEQEPCAYQMMSSHKGPLVHRSVHAEGRGRRTHVDWDENSLIKQEAVEETRKALQAFLAELAKSERMIAPPANPDAESPYVLIEQVTDGKYSSSVIYPEGFAMHQAKIEELMEKFAKVYGNRSGR